MANSSLKARQGAVSEVSIEEIDFGFKQWFGRLIICQTTFYIRPSCGNILPCYSIIRTEILEKLMVFTDHLYKEADGKNDNHCTGYAIKSLDGPFFNSIAQFSGIKSFDGIHT